MKDAYSFDRDEEGLDAQLRLIEAYDGSSTAAACAGTGRVGRRDDGRRRRPRVHGSLPGGGERGRAGPRLRRERRDRLGRAATSRAAGAAGRAAKRLRRPGLTTVEEVADPPASPPGADQGDAGRRRGRGWSSSCARRPPPQRDQARATRSTPISARSSSEEIEAELGPVGYLRPDRQSGCRSIKDAALERQIPTSPAPTSRTPTCAASTLRPVTRGHDEVDVRTVEAGDTAPWLACEIAIETAIEVGNIFKLMCRKWQPG